MKYIDQSKKSNRRCCNCGYYAGASSDIACKNCHHQDNKDKMISYWNCCDRFKWREDRQYIRSDGGVVRPA